MPLAPPPSPPHIHAPDSARSLARARPEHTTRSFLATLCPPEDNHVSALARGHLASPLRKPFKDDANAPQKIGRYSLPDGAGDVPFSLSPSWGSHSLRLEVASASQDLSDLSIAACVGVGGVKWRSISPVGYADEARGRYVRVRVVLCVCACVQEGGQSVQVARPSHLSRLIRYQSTGAGRL